MVRKNHILMQEKYLKNFKLMIIGIESTYFSQLIAIFKVALHKCMGEIWAVDTTVEGAICFSSSIFLYWLLQ